MWVFWNGLLHLVSVRDGIFVWRSVICRTGKQFDQAIYIIIIIIIVVVGLKVQINVSFFTREWLGCTERLKILQRWNSLNTGKSFYGFASSAVISAEDRPFPPHSATPDSATAAAVLVVVDVATLAPKKIYSHSLRTRYIAFTADQPCRRNSHTHKPFLLDMPETRQTTIIYRRTVSPRSSDLKLLWITVQPTGLYNTDVLYDRTDELYLHVQRLLLLQQTNYAFLQLTLMLVLWLLCWCSRYGVVCAWVTA